MGMEGSSPEGAAERSQVYPQSQGSRQSSLIEDFSPVTPLLLEKAKYT
jgi:hypothetical protein